MINHGLTENITVKDMVKVLGRWTVEEHLFDIAVRNAKKAAQNIDRDNMDKMQVESKYSIISIVMSLFSLEALANSIGMEYYGSNPNPERRKKWRKIVKKMPLGNKLKLLATDAYQQMTKSKEKKTLSKDITKLIDDLVDLRNHIVHYKAIPIETKKLRWSSKNEPVSIELEIYTSATARKGIESVVKVVNAFNKLSKKQYGEWIQSVLDRNSMKI